MLAEALERARKEAVVVTVEGPAGIGKTALLQAFAAGEARRERVFWLRCDRYERDVDFAAAEVLLGAGVPADRGELEVGRDLLARLGGVRPHRHRATVVIIDDAQWMDGSSARSIRFALRRLHVERLLTIVSRRAGSRHATAFETADPARTIDLRLEPLDPKAVITLAQDLRGWQLPESTAQRLIELTGGLPLLLDIVLRRACDAAQLASGDIPRSAHSSTQEMLNSLDVDSRRLVEAAAVIAEPADVAVLTAVAAEPGRMDAADVADGLAGAVAAGLLVEHQAAIGVAHALLSQAVYESLPSARRRELHRRAATWTTGSRRLGHQASAAEGADPALAAELISSADAARDQRRYAQAAFLREQARALSPDPHQRDNLHLQALLDRIAAQDLARAERLATDAEDMSPSPLRSLALGLLRREQARIVEAETHLRDAIATAPADHPSLHQQAALALATLQARINQGEAAVQTLDGIRVENEPELAGDIETTRGISLWQAGRPEAAEEVLSRHPLPAHDTAWKAELLGARGMVRLYAGLLSASLRDLDASIALSPLWRPSTNQVRVYLLRSHARFHLGDWDGAALDAAAGHAIATSQSQLWSLPLASAGAVPVPAWRGQWDAAQRHVDEGMASLTPQLSKSTLGSMVRLSRLQLLEARGEYEQLLVALEPMMADQELEGLSPLRSYRRVLPQWIRACITVGRLAEAGSALARYERLLVRWPNGAEASAVGLLRGLLAQAQGNDAAARRHFAADLADPEVGVRPLQLGRLHQAAGRLEAQAGNRQVAIDHLSKAITVFTRLQAVPLLESCRSDLAALGTRVPATRQWGLTEREFSVVALVRRGFTNNEIARELLVTNKTVEFHLTRIYAKVGVRSRHELRRMTTPEPSAQVDVRQFDADQRMGVTSPVVAGMTWQKSGSGDGVDGFGE